VRLAFVFPGQGAGIEREARTWWQGSPRVRELVAIAARHAAVSVEDLMAGVGRAVMPTERLEPVLTAVCLGIHDELMERGARANVVLGHSLGEIAACAAAGCCSSEEAVWLAAERGRLMAREAARRPGGMVMIAAESREVVDEAVAFGRPYGIIGIAGHNAPRQWLVSGEWPALRRLAIRIPAIPVAVTGAWHCAILAEAVAPFREAARRVLTRPIVTPFIANRTGDLVACTEDLHDLLADQLVHPIEWVRSMRTLAGSGVTHVVTVGPSRIVRGLVRFNLGSGVALHSTDAVEDLQRVTEVVAG
jgi:[acyl-carrier-protein] S-malonyltransferase